MFQELLPTIIVEGMLVGRILHQPEGGKAERLRFGDG